MDTKIIKFDLLRDGVGGAGGAGEYLFVGY
jgi:hypothetical protein